MKKIIIILLSFMILVSCGKTKTESSEEEETMYDHTLLDESDEYITRDEWIRNLCTKFGIVSETSKPYFTDVNKDNPHFKYIQAAYEYQLIDGETLETSEYVTPAYAIRTIMKIKDPLLSFLEDETDEGIINYANDNYLFFSIIDDEYVKKSDVNSLLNYYAFDYYMERDNNSLNTIKYSDDLKDLSSYNSSINDNTITIENIEIKELNNGDNIVITNEEYPYGIAKKIENITYNGGNTIINTSEPDLQEIVEEIDISDKVYPSIDNVTLNDGVSYNNDLNNLYGPSNMAFGDFTYASSPLSFSVDINLTKGRLNIDPAYDAIDVKFKQKYDEFFGRTTKDEDGLFFKDKTINELFNKEESNNDIPAKYTSGYEITGKASFTDIYFEIENKGLDFSNTMVKTHYNANLELKVKGKLEEEIEIYKMLVPVCIGVWIDVSFCLYSDVNGELQVKIKSSQTSIVRVINGYRSESQQSSLEKEAKANIEGEFGTKPKASLYILGLELLDSSFSLGIDIEASTTVHINEDNTDAMICSDLSINAPIIKFEVGTSDKSIAHKLGLSATISIFDKKNALYQSQHYNLLHYEIDKQQSRFVNSCTWGKEPMDSLINYIGLDRDTIVKQFGEGNTIEGGYNPYSFPLFIETYDDMILEYIMPDYKDVESSFDLYDGVFSTQEYLQNMVENKKGYLFSIVITTPSDELYVDTYLPSKITKQQYKDFIKQSAYKTEYDSLLTKNNNSYDVSIYYSYDKNEPDSYPKSISISSDFYIEGVSLFK